MKKLLSASIAAATIAGFAAPAAAVEGLSANAGLVSDYYFRGVNLGDAGAYAGVDYEIAGFYVGAWAIDDGAGGSDGIETDYYLGYGMEHGEFSWSVGATTYQYTYISDSETEMNVGLAYSGFGLDIAVGTATDDMHDNNTAKDVENDYAVVAVSWSGDVFGAVVGFADTAESEKNANDDSDYMYAEVSAGGEVATMDMGVTLGRVLESSANGDDTGSGDYYIFLDISKSFDL